MEFNTRKSKIIILCIFGTLIFAGLIYIASIYISLQPKLRYYFDIAFNLTKENVTYMNGVKYTLPLPGGLARLHSDSESSRIYWTELTVEEIVLWYRKNGYSVESNRIYTEGLYYTIENIGTDDNHPKRNYIEITRQNSLNN